MDLVGEIKPCKTEKLLKIVEKSGQDSLLLDIDLPSSGSYKGGIPGRLEMISHSGYQSFQLTPIAGRSEGPDKCRVCPAEFLFTKVCGVTLAQSPSRGCQTNLVHVTIGDLLSGQGTSGGDHDSGNLVKVTASKNQLLSSISASFRLVARN